ncbi:group III truncated hemoglobin [Spongiimicrobium salis]|uniref:group III truncated hemoglobin n=1 Tax=Spongiimicrobium salis TaxID=1667022 RepID=UPI00374CC320
MTKEIETRKDVYRLVVMFYGKIREDDLLGPIFNTHIKDWEAHFELLTDFWESNLFFVKKYSGNPLLKHQEVDASENYTLEQLHFGRWLNLWFQTINDLYHGEKATIAKNRARNMSTFFYLSIFKARGS